MVTGRNNVFNCAANFLRGRKCIFFCSFTVYKTRRGYVKCSHCKRQKSLKQMRREITIITGFYQLQPAYRLALDIGLDYQSITRVCHRLRETIYHVAELDAGKFKGEIEIDEAYFGGRRKGRRVRGAVGKSKGSVYYSDTFKSYKPLKRLGKHHRFNHGKALAYRGKNHINGIEGL